MAITYIVSWARIFTDLNKLSTNELALAYALSAIAFYLLANKKNIPHLNPAISLSLVLLRKIHLTNAVFRMIS